MKTPRYYLITFFAIAFSLVVQPAAAQAPKKSLQAFWALKASRLTTKGGTVAQQTAVNAAKKAKQAVTSLPTGATLKRGVSSSVKNQSTPLSTVDAQQLQTILRERQATAASRFKQNWMPESPWKKVEEILDQNKHPVAALRALWRLEDQYRDKHFFSWLATAYYKRNIATHTPHLREFFKQVEKQHSRTLEEKVMKRMYFIVLNKDWFRKHFAPNIPNFGLRMRYTKDIAKLTPDSFQPGNLVISFERKLTPGQGKASIRHVNRKSVFTVGSSKTPYPVYQYNGPTEFIPNLYLYLVNGSHPKDEITILFDEKARSLAIYNRDHSLWLRITPHEYASPNNLHLHLNETRTVLMHTEQGKEIKETVNFNLFIPLGTPAALPKYKQDQYLYDIMIARPIRYFQGNAHVKIIKKDIF